MGLPLSLQYDLGTLEKQTTTYSTHKDQVTIPMRMHRYEHFQANIMPARHNPMLPSSVRKAD